MGIGLTRPVNELLQILPQDSEIRIIIQDLDIRITDHGRRTLATALQRDPAAHVRIAELVNTGDDVFAEAGYRPGLPLPTLPTTVILPPLDDEITSSPEPEATAPDAPESTFIYPDT